MSVRQGRRASTFVHRTVLPPADHQAEMSKQQQQGKGRGRRETKAEIERDRARTGVSQPQE